MLWNDNIIKIVALAIVCVLAPLGRDTRGQQEQQPIPLPTGRAPASPFEPFRPSNTKTTDGTLIPVDQFYPAGRCEKCHHDTFSSWEHSLHRNAGREPFYRDSADLLVKARGLEFTRHCEACHTPVALVAGALNKDVRNTSPPFTKLDDEGVTCTVCHSITETRPDGTGSYTIRRPALLARPDGTPIYGDISDDRIMADIPGHKRAVMRPLLRTPEFCATCHTAVNPPDLNGYKSLRGFATYDEWQQSKASLESITPFYSTSKRADCRTCHMPRIESSNDVAAKNGTITSHRWLGANTAAPLFYGQMDQVENTEKFLASGIFEVDIFSITRSATGERIAPLNPENARALSLTPGEEITAEVVVSNRGAAHSFPPELRDLYEPWVEFQSSGCRWQRSLSQRIRETRW